MIVGLLGLQGAFLDHIPHFNRLGVNTTIVRDRHSLDRVDRLVIPGGESTVMAKFLLEYNMATHLKERIDNGLPVWGICAGAILLAREIDGSAGPLDALPAAVTRNAYGRQINSRQQRINIPLFGISAYPAIFIRAPKFDDVDASVIIHAYFNESPVFIQYDHVMATTFHPELNAGEDFHRYFLKL